MVPVYWDNGGQASGAESFALFNRDTGKVLHPLLLEAMRRATTRSSSLSEIPPPASTR
jgi:hypothetical protein